MGYTCCHLTFITENDYYDSIIKLNFAEMRFQGYVELSNSLQIN